MSDSKTELLKTNLSFDKNDLVAVTVSALEEHLMDRKEELEQQAQTAREALSEARDKVLVVLKKYVKEASGEKLATARKALQALATKGVRIKMTMEDPYLSVDAHDDCDEDEEPCQKMVVYCDFELSVSGKGNGNRDDLYIRLCYPLPKEVNVLHKEIEDLEKQYQEINIEANEVDEALRHPDRYERKARAALASRSLKQRGEEGQEILAMLQDIVKPRTRQTRQIGAKK